jgi:alpha-tubulin suppressor-like RCC1 family protein
MNLVRAYRSMGEYLIFITEDGTVMEWGKLNSAKRPRPLEIPENLFPADTKVVRVHNRLLRASLFLSFISPLPQISVGTGHSSVLLLTSQHRVILWEGSSAPTEITFPPSERVVQVDSGALHYAAITESGNLYTWGRNPYGQLGIVPYEESALTPTKASLPSPVASVSCGYAHTIITLENGTYYGCGRNDSGELGLGYCTASVKVPTLITFKFEPAEVFVGGYYSMAISRDRKLYSCGWNRYGILGVKISGDVADYTLVKLQGRVKEVATEGLHNLLLMEDGTLWEWGQSVCVGEDQLIPTPVRFDNGERPICNFVGIGCGESTAWAITDEGKLWTWGRANGHGDDPIRYPKELDLTFKVPPLSCQQLWGKVFKWFWFGRLDGKSPLAQLPVEVVWHCVGVFA